MAFHITALYAAALTLLYLGLCTRIVRLRVKYKVSLGDGGQPELFRAIRAQANFVEYVPLALILIGLLEAAGMRGWLVHLFGMALFVGRAAHAFGLSRSDGPSPGRGLGMVLTWGTMLVAAIALVVVHKLG
ncbi:MAG: glutathione metabolism protein [Alphaproteobacteria bacterium]|nr:glutathione metabolism protein [Alphaproteobacteria bacterium]